ncbi:hypothetical protein ACH4FX_05965 [Streptomyces sp. NPDC018019]|uniref:hypothetical protein n=1 Tax=Streptomyces sp. NPDC018019 TaxID=3365030 RepID=UPI0037AE9B77
MRQDATRAQQDGHASENGNVHQLGHGKQVIGLTGRHVIALVAATMSLALMGMLASYLLYRSETHRDPVGGALPESPRTVAEGGDVKVAVGMQAEGGSVASKYMPNAAEERKHFAVLGSGWGSAEYRSFARKQHLVRTGGNAVKLSVTNVGERRIRVINIKPIQLRREEPIDEVVYEPCCGAGGEEGLIADLDLDSPQPRLIVDKAEYFKGHSIPVDPGDSFDVFVNYTSKKYYASFLFEVNYLNGVGELKALPVEDYDPVARGERRFEVTAPPAGGLSGYKRIYRPMQLEPDPKTGAARFRYQRIAQ